MTAIRQVGAGLDQSDVDALAARASGPVFLPGQQGYAEELEGFDRSVTHRPALVLAATSAEDVALAVRFACEHGLGVAVQNTGHGVAVPADAGALLVTTSRMTRHEVDPVRRTARIEAGVLWQDVIATAAEHGLAPLSGSAPFVGAVSYVLGGGIGVLSRRHGYAADHVRWIDVVTADGRMRRASAEEHPDLFWALRGGKGNFGVVTAIEVDLFPVSRLYGGGLYFDAASTRHVLHTYRSWVTGAPEELSTSFAMVPFPDVPLVPEPLRGRFALHLRVSHLGSSAEGERLIRPLRAAAPRLLDTVGEMAYADVGRIHDDPPVAGSYHINTFQLTELGPDTVEALLELAGPDADGTLVIEIRHLGGALSRPPRTPNAVAHREAPFQLYTASVLGEGRDEQVRAAHDRLVARLRPWDSGYRTLNFMAGVAHSDPADVRAAFTEDAYARLVEVKTSYDPTNVFRFNHNIPPDLPVGGGDHAR